jgi:hypothetical protein
MLLVVAYPTAEETRAAAAAGNEAAAAELPLLDARAAFVERAERHALRDPADLPDLAGDDLRIDWDFQERDDGKWTVLRHGETVLWEELAFFEGYERFASSA